MLQLSTLCSRDCSTQHGNLGCQSQQKTLTLEDGEMSVIPQRFQAGHIHCQVRCGSWMWLGGELLALHCSHFPSGHSLISALCSCKISHNTILMLERFYKGWLMSSLWENLLSYSCFKTNRYIQPLWLHLFTSAKFTLNNRKKGAA